MSARDPRRAAKAVLGRALFAAGLHKRTFKNRAMITCFHSISEEGNSTITTSEAEFIAFCDFLARHFDVIGLDALLDRLAAGADISGAAVITFDDGYADNATLAAPILADRNLPATFFLATQFIGTEHQAWWDTPNDIRSRWMTWDQARSLHAQGFSLGAHTQTHVDLGAVSLDEARAELQGSIRDIEREVGQAPTLFAYPFGGVNNMRDDVRELIAALGLRCCPSSHGGLVRPDSDPYHLRRVPVTQWYQSPYQLGWELVWLHDDHVVDEAPVSQPGSPSS